MQIFAMNKLCDKMNIKPYATSLWSKYSYYILAIQITQTTFFNKKNPETLIVASLASCLKTCRATIVQINTNHYYVPEILV